MALAGARSGAAAGATAGAHPATESALIIYGGADWDTINRLLTGTGSGYRGKTGGGFTVAHLVRFDTQVNGAWISDALDGTGKGYDVRQDTATTVVWRVANAAGNNWFNTAQYSPAAHMGKLQLLVMVHTGTFLQHWASDEKVGADVATDGYTQPALSVREAVGCRLNGTNAHTGLAWFGRGGWDRAFSEAEVHALYDAVAATGRIPLGLPNEVSVYNVTANAVPPNFPAIVQNLVTPGTGDATFVLGSASGITLVSEVI